MNLLDKKQEQLVLVEWCGGDNVENQGNSIPEIFSIQVERNLEKCALSDGARALSYHQLDQEIEKLCTALRVSGVKEGAIVAICLERSIAAVTVIYALHRLGAAYVPIDPSYPKGRMAFMMEESKAVAVITDEKNADQFKNANCVLLLDINKTELISVIGELQPEVEFKNGAYILFTSGSTGKPKGVQISQPNLVHSNQNRFSFYDEVPERFLLLPSFSFDSSVAGLFWPLCGGGSLFVPPHGIEHDINALANFISENKITSTLILPSLYALLLEHAKASDLLTLKTVIVAGEACTPKLVDVHYLKLPNCKLYNEYGPTEASVWSTACLLKQGDKKVPIGRPLNNAQVYLLNSALQPVLPGHVGELYIGGKGLSNGYINRPQENNSFVGNPNNRNERMYRTGDLARFDSNGNLLFVGRKDQQVKINGKRVELQEISTSIATVASVEQAHVLYQEVELNSMQDSEEELTAERFFTLSPSKSVEILQQIQAYGPEELNALLANLEE